MGQMIGSFIVNHHEYFVGIASGLALAHVPEMTLFAFHYAMKVPWFRSVVLSDPKRSKAVIAQIEQALEKGIDEEAQKADAEKAAEAPKEN